MSSRPEPTYVCACGVQMPYLVWHQGFWKSLWSALVFTVFGVVVELVLLAGGLAGIDDHNTAAVWVCFGILGAIVAVALLVAVLGGHRWWCLVKRWVQYTLVGPAVIFSLMSSLNF